MKPRRQTERRKKFVDLMSTKLIKGDKVTITDVAKQAGFSEKTAYSIGSELLKKPEIQEAIETRCRTAAEKLGITPEYVLGNYKKIAEVHSKEVSKTLGNGENVFTVTEMVDAQAALKANEMLGKHLKLFTDTVEITGKGGKDLIPIEERKTNLARKIASFLASKTADKE